MSESATTLHANIREAVGFFDTEKQLQETIDDLLEHGFHRAEISVLASIQAVEKKLGHYFDKVDILEDNPQVPHAAYVSKDSIGDAEGALLGGFMYVGAMIGVVPVVASGGALAAALTAAAIGGGVGTTLGAILAGIVGHHHSKYISDQLLHGGLLLWVRTFTLEDEIEAIRIMSNHSGIDVHVHGLPNVQTELEDTFLGVMKNAQAREYKGASIIRVDNGAYYTSGKIFVDAKEAEAYIDRVEYVQALHAEKAHSSVDVKAAMIDPADVFASPIDLEKSDLNVRDKIEILRRWAYIEKELEIASDDGMPNSDKGDRLQEITTLIRKLKAL